MRKEDMRRKRTRKALKRSLIELLSKETIEQISIIDICDKAEINRVTFYTHYKDKYELLHEVLTDLVIMIDTNSKEYFMKNRTNDPIRDYVNAMSHTIYKTCFENKEMMQKLSIQENSIFSSMLDEIISNLATESLKANANHVNLKYPPEFIVKFVFGGFSNIIFNWALKNNDISEKVFFENFNKLLYSILKAQIFYS